MPRPRLAVLLTCALLSAGCASEITAPPVPPSGQAVRKLGESFRTRHGDVYMLRVQDEYHLIRCIPTSSSGAIAGNYEDVFTMPRDRLTDDASAQSKVRWNTWIPVPELPGLDINFLSPEWISLRETADAPPR